MNYSDIKFTGITLGGKIYKADGTVATVEDGIKQTVTKENDNKITNVSKIIYIITMTIFVLLLIPLAIISIYIGSQHHDDICQTTDKIDFALYEWLIGAGILTLIPTILIMIFITLMFFQLIDGKIYSGLSIAIFSLMLYIAFFILITIYSIIGGIILYRNNIKCLENGTSLGIMSQIMLCFYWLYILSAVGIGLLKK